MDTNQPQESRSYGAAVGMFFGVTIAQSLVSYLLFGAYTTGILPLIECSSSRLFGSLAS